MHELINQIFSLLCHQNPARCWAPDGEVIAFCQRCTGVYAGAALTAALIPLMRFSPSRFTSWLHGLFLLQTPILGFHLLPDIPMIRTLSGQIFSAGVIYFLWLNLQIHRGLFRTNQSPAKYYIGLILSIILLQGLVHFPWKSLAAFIDILGLCGFVVLIILTLLTFITLIESFISLLRLRKTS